jgi:tetratricopeptide (TPR) repeat protein
MANKNFNSRLILFTAFLLCLCGCAKNPENAEARINQGDESFAAKDYDKAVANYTAAIGVKPEADTFQKRAKAYAAKGQHEQAINDFHQVLDRDQESAEAWVGLGISSIETKDFTVAEAAFQKALRLKPDYTQAYYWRAMLSKAEDKKDNAIADFKKYLEVGTDAKLKESAQTLLKELGAK